MHFMTGWNWLFRHLMQPHHTERSNMIKLKKYNIIYIWYILKNYKIKYKEHILIYTDSTNNLIHQA